MMNEQSSSAVYGLFFEEDFEGQTLLGLYFLEGEAGAAREAYIAKQLEEFSVSESKRVNARDYYEHAVTIRRLQVGQAPCYNFVG